MHLTASVRSVPDDTYFQTLLSLLSIDTQNPPGETRAAIDWLEIWFTDRNIETRRLAVDEAKPNLLATIPGESEYTLLYQGHVDTVPFDDSQWSYDPLGEGVDNRIYGRGATDMKGALASMLVLADTLATLDSTPPITVQFLFVSDEETAGQAGLPSVLDADMLRADASVIGETTSTIDRYSVTVADRGSIWLTLAAEGTAAHGSRPMIGDNAIDRLCEVLAALNQRLPDRTFQFSPDVEPIIGESVEYYADSIGREAAAELFEHPTVNVGTIEGGTAVNSVPEQARARVDIRLSPGVETQAVLSDIRECLSEFPAVSIADVSWSTGTYEPLSSPLVSALQSTVSAVTGKSLHARSATGGGDVKKLRNAGIPTVEFGVGTDTVHGVDEYTTIEALRKNTEIYAGLVAELCGDPHAN